VARSATEQAVSVVRAPGSEPQKILGYLHVIFHQKARLAIKDRYFTSLLAISKYVFLIYYQLHGHWPPWRQVFAHYLPPESTFGNKGQLFHQVIGNIKISAFLIYHELPGHRLPCTGGRGQGTQSLENFEVFACYLSQESTFGSKGQLFQQVIGNLKICIFNIPSALWLSASLAAGVGDAVPGKFRGFCMLFDTRKHFWQ